jgi:hypothetical protein
MTSVPFVCRIAPWPQRTVLERRGIKPLLWPRNAGSYPGFVFTDAPLSLASGHFG